ncbi:alpha-1,3-mannosyl-glycoprotein 4-beta-N-acetylglucosaminyltransferase C-like [Patiria miniata]|uniref:MGAT4 conserved region domain-containing protein n=1 Tax=Patiria miniata TaxID=46514 RepID=A0A914AYZ8_PATMI|nr:alpha-1,3-mannosyl-glycoprotein 4-beta-N-acetylglucosaminyltransferase C-like [Patiria miniata]XP_038068893.1 alpha-1,3-mannosyl-glycoprotein 4-beta-N-acetylglucosaminyltransferase C-like [Patiria miniata]
MGIKAWLCLQKRWLWLTVACVIVVVIAARNGLELGDTRGIVAQGYSNLPWMPEVLVRYTTEQTRTALDGTWSIDTGIDPTKVPGLTSDMGCMNLPNLDRDKALVLGHRRKERGFLTIGITTVERINASYLYQTLNSLIVNTNATERSQMSIVVFACDFKESARQEARDIVFRFPKHLESGFLQLIEAPRSFYPPLKNLKRTFDNPDERVYWRSKENIDNVFLFAYSVSMSDYYLQLDDDFTTVPGYVSTIRRFIALNRAEHWILLDISDKGTGKLFRDWDLLHVARYLVQFYQEQPVDFLFSALMQLHLQRRHFVVKPHIFKHLGNVSSLELKNKGRHVHH